MPYFCYISKSKVDSLYENTNKEMVLSEKRTKVREYDLNSEAEASVGLTKLFNVFNGKIQFGRKGIVQTEKDIKASYTQKLFSVLKSIDSGDESDNLIDALEQKRYMDKLYYKFNGEFYIIRPYIKKPSSDDIITIQSTFKVGEKEYVLLLDCSVKNFSDVNSEGKYEINSSNFRFFKKQIPLRFSTQFMLLTVMDSTIIGTPLYLVLFDENYVL
jgi:hypothetical protein